MSSSVSSSSASASCSASATWSWSWSWSCSCCGTYKVAVMILRDLRFLGSHSKSRSCSRLIRSGAIFDRFLSPLKYSVYCGRWPLTQCFRCGLSLKLRDEAVAVFGFVVKQILDSFVPRIFLRLVLFLIFGTGICRTVSNSWCGYPKQPVRSSKQKKRRCNSIGNFEIVLVVVGVIRGEALAVIK